MAVAQPADVETALGRPLTSGEQTQAAWWLTGTELLIAKRLGLVAELDEGALIYVEAEVVAAKVRSAARDGKTSRSVSVDDATITDRYEPVTSSDIADAWWDLLSPSPVASAYTIAMTSPVDVP